MSSGSRFIRHLVHLLALTALLVPATASGAAPAWEPSERTLFLRTGTAASHAEACSQLVLRPEDGPDWSGCSVRMLHVLPPCPSEPACERPSPPLVWRTGQLAGPLVVDASRPATGVIGISSWRTGVCTQEGCTMLPPVAAGTYTVRASLSATTAEGAGIALGSDATTYTILPGEVLEWTFGIALPAAADRMAVTSLDLAVEIRGQGALHGIVEMEDIASRFTLPTFVCRDPDGCAWSQ